VAKPEDERDKAPSEDLFEDLDKFFAPIEESDWPEPGEPSAPPVTPAVPSAGDEEILPQGWADEVAEAAGSEDLNGERDTALDGEAAWPAIDGEGEEEEAYLFGGADAEDEELASRATGPEGGGELTLDDLKIAPPEYAALPGPKDEGDTSEEEPVFADEFGAPSGPDTPMADVERAADHFAEGIREEPPPSVEEDLLSDLHRAPSGPPRMVKVGPDEPIAGTGPAWEEPMSQPVVSETLAEPGARNIPAALISGLALAALALILIAIGPAPFAFLAAAVVLLAQGELYAVARKRGHQPATALGLVVGGILLFAAYNKGEAAMGFVVSLSLALTFLWYMAAPAKARKDATTNVAITLLGIVYVPFFAGFLFMLLPLPGGRAIALAIIGITIIYDVVAFAVGSLWGHRPLAPTISPNKSWEGAIGASIVSLLVALVAGPSIEPFTVGTSIGLALVVVAVAPLGDLVESLMKRDLGVKDMGSILPGHGGLLDRIDSLLLVLPAAFYFLRLVF
jgi:phosphatidate cytidylyltransferase